MPRHILTPEERLKGGKTARAKLAASGRAHKLTAADSRKGALAVHAYARTIGVHPGHVLTAADRRKGGLIAGAKRRAARIEALVTLALHKAPQGLPCDCGACEGEEHTQSCARWAVAKVPAKRGSESLLGNPKDWVDVIPVADLPALGASLAGKLREPRFTQPGPMGGPMSAPIAKPRVDPFTLSALKRFRLGPKSPLELTRSQRAHVDIMRAEGYLMATGDSMLALTERGRQAVESDENP